MRILLVEDHRESRRSLQRLLERRGHDVAAVENAEQAEKVVSEEKFRLIILDWMLPGKSGLELCRDLNAHPNRDEMFILLVTARSETEDLKQALDAGANDYLTKPLDLGLLNVRLAVAEGRIRVLAERAQARAELQATARRMVDILENTSDGFFALDGEWRFTYLNARAETTFGRSRSELLGRDARRELPSMVGTVFEKKCRDVMDQHRSIDFEAPDSATGKNWYEVKAYPNGEGVSVFFRDVTERKRLEEERLTAGKLESLGTLAGGIAHDLNNILTVISGNIGLARVETPGESRVLLSALSKVDQASQHAARLVGQLLTFSRGGAPVKKVASLADLLRQSTELSLYGSNLRAQMDVQAELWNAEVDMSQIEQVINALIINARDAMPHGGTIDVSAVNVELKEEAGGLLSPGRYVKVSITDRGDGIEKALSRKIFDPYFTTKPTGSGLGLSIAHSVITKHGGMVLLESSSPAGSTFAFYLPATDAPVAVAGSPATQSTFDFGQLRVLIMDDEGAIRDLTSQLLGTLGYQATAVPDGHEAVQTYERALRRGEAFQAVILDATIRGGMGGLATIERLRKMDPNVNAIICSGYSDEAALSQFLTYGFRAALPKPFTRNELADVLRRSLEAAKLD
jgi:two-component system cell cycle sensor histidine kinase/response regulator CckA